jgi:hypothetical protein
MPANFLPAARLKVYIGTTIIDKVRFVIRLTKVKNADGNRSGPRVGDGPDGQKAGNGSGKLPAPQSGERRGGAGLFAPGGS